MNEIQTIDKFNTIQTIENFNTINTLQLNNNNKIKCVFGNHNVLQLFMRFITNKTGLLILPPFSPVMARSICMTYPDATFINARYVHQALMRKLSKELLSKYPLYSILI
jgi:hypothetical protein